MGSTAPMNLDSTALSGFVWGGVACRALVCLQMHLWKIHMLYSMIFKVLVSMSISAWCTNWVHGTSLCFEEIAITFPVLHPNPRDLGVKIKVIYKKTSTRLHHQTVIVPTNCEIHGYASYVWDCLSIAIHRLVISLILVVDIKLHFKTNIKNRTNDEQNTSIFCLYLFIWAACQ